MVSLWTVRNCISDRHFLAFLAGFIGGNHFSDGGTKPHKTSKFSNKRQNLRINALEAMFLNALEAMFLNALEAMFLNALEAMFLNALEAMFLNTLEAMFLNALEAMF